MKVFFVSLLICSSAMADGLESVMFQALAADPRISIADYQLEIGKNQDRQALGSLLPQISGTANLSSNERRVLSTGGSHSSYSGEKYSIVLQQKLYNQSAFSELSRTEHLVKQRNFEKEGVLGQVLLEVAERYLDILDAEDDLALVRQEDRSIQIQLDQVTRLYDKKLARVTDLYEIESRKSFIKVNEIEALNAVEVAKEALSELTGAPVGPLNALKQSVGFVALEGSIDDWLQRVRQNNPDLLALQEAISVTRSEYDSAKGRHLPTLDLQLSSQRSDTGFENSEAPKTESNMLALTLNIPFYEGGKTSAKTREVSNRLSIAQMENERTVRSLINSTRKAYQNVQSSVQRIAATELSIQSANKSSQAMAASFKYGTVTVIEVADALQKEYQARRELLRVRYDHMRFRLRLLYYAGELFPENISQLDDWFSRVDL